MGSSPQKTHRRSIRAYLLAILRRYHNNSGQTTAIAPPPKVNAQSIQSASSSTVSILPKARSSKYNNQPYIIAGRDQSGHKETQTLASKRILFSTRSNLSLCQYDYQQSTRDKYDLIDLSTPTALIKHRKRTDSYSQSSTDSSQDDHELSILRTTPTSSGNLPLTPDTSASLHLLSPLSQLALKCNVPGIYRHGTSLQASLASLNTGLSTIRSASTLKLQRSTQDLCAEYRLSPASHKLYGKPSLSQFSEYEDNEQDGDNVNTSILIADGTTLCEQIQDHPYACETVGTSTAGSSIKHFTSFCVLDAATPGYPVTAVSHDLQRVFDIGDRFCVDSAGIDCMDTDTIVAEDEHGNVVLYLILYNPLINPGSGRSRFILATMLDITPLMADGTSLSQQSANEEIMIGEKDSTGTAKKGPPKSHGGELSAENLLAGCYIHEDTGQPANLTENDIWFDIASEETRPLADRSEDDELVRNTRPEQLSHDVIDNFLQLLQDLYFDFFLLGKSPLDENSYEICNVSLQLFEDREYIEGHLTSTSAKVRMLLEYNLRRNNAFDIEVRWGKAGIAKQLYCNPIFGRTNVTWICFLVEPALACKLK